MERPREFLPGDGGIEEVRRLIGGVDIQGEEALEELDDLAGLYAGLFKIEACADVYSEAIKGCADGDADLIFDPDYEGKWARTVARLGIDPGQLSGQSGRA